MQDLKAWFDKCIYDQGVNLYLKYGNDPTLRALFAEDYSDFKNKKLHRVLSELLENYEQPATKKAVQQRQVEQSPAIAHRGWPATLDPVLQTLHDQWKPLFVEMMNMQARIYDVALMAEQTNQVDKKEEACQLAHRILDIDEQMEQIYAQRDYYIVHGKLPETIVKEKEVVGDPVRWATELQNQERYVRRYRGKLKKDPKNKNAANWALKLKEAEEMVALYKRKLKLDE